MWATTPAVPPSVASLRPRVCVVPGTLDASQIDARRYGAMMQRRPSASGVHDDAAWACHPAAAKQAQVACLVEQQEGTKAACVQLHVAPCLRL